MISGIRVKEGNLANPTVWIIRIFKTADGWRKYALALYPNR